MRATVVPEIVEEDECDEVDVTGGGEGDNKIGGSSLSALYYKPVHLLSQYRDPQKRGWRVVLVIVLPSGILDAPNGVRAFVEDGNSVKLR